MTEIEVIEISLWKEDGDLVGEVEIVDFDSKFTKLCLDIKTAYIIVTALRSFVISQGKQEGEKR